MFIFVQWVSEIRTSLNFRQLLSRASWDGLSMLNNFLFYVYNAIASPDFGIWAGQNCIRISAFSGFRHSPVCNKTFTYIFVSTSNCKNYLLGNIKVNSLKRFSARNTYKLKVNGEK